MCATLPLASRCVTDTRNQNRQAGKEAEMDLYFVLLELVMLLEGAFVLGTLGFSEGKIRVLH